MNDALHLKLPKGSNPAHLRRDDQSACWILRQPLDVVDILVARQSAVDPSVKSRSD